MTSFLENLSEQLYRNHHDRLEDIMVIFPNRRAGLFFRQYFASQITQPVWSPEVLSIEDFIKQLSGLQTADRLTLVFELYNVFRKLSPHEERFDQFFFWGDILLNDFDEIDKYLVNPGDIFTNLKNLRELDSGGYEYLTEHQKEVIRKFWKNFGEGDSDNRQRFLQVWEILFSVYQHFQNSLLANNQGYTGMLFREVAENIRELSLKIEKKNVVFAGFNALNTAEEAIIKYFVQNQNASIHWDLDAYYMEKSYHEAGTFLRGHAQKSFFAQSIDKPFPQLINSGGNKKITITGVPMSVGQAKYTGEVLQDLLNYRDINLEKTVIVLPDEHMLFPVLYSLPEEVEKINVTMGYPLQHTSLYSLIEHTVNLQQYAVASNDGVNQNKVKFHYRPVLALLRHPYVQGMVGEFAAKIIHKIEAGNLVYVDQDVFEEGGAFLKELFRQVIDVQGLFGYLLHLLSRIHDHLAEESRGGVVLEQEYIYHFYTHLTRLQNIVATQGINLDFDTFLKLFRQIIRSLRLPFSGEPVNGLQVMGVLETRNLDFDNVFILSMNEGIFPPQSSGSSFIPHNLRKGFGLPAYDHSDSIYAYLFYRLLHRTKNVYLFYNTEETRESGEMSRFLYQILFEKEGKMFPGKNGFQVFHQTMANPVELPASKTITIPKDEQVLALLERYKANNGNPLKRLTPSALNTYLDCRLKFYFKYVAGIEEKEEVQEEVDPLVFGNILHHTLEYIYKNLQAQKGDHWVLKDDFEYLNQQLPNALETAFKEHYGLTRRNFTYEGRNVIAREIILKLAGEILEQDQEYAPFEIIGLEAKSEDGYFLDIPLSGNGEKVGLKGIIDRIDRKENRARVLDYKTGRDDKSVSSIAALFDREVPKRKKAVMQAFFYALLYLEKSGQEGEKVVPGLFNARELFDSEFDYRIKLEKNRVEDFLPLRDEFIGHLQELLDEIFNPEVSFDQTDNEDHCRICPYKGICKRGK